MKEKKYRPIPRSKIRDRIEEIEKENVKLSTDFQRARTSFVLGWKAHKLGGCKEVEHITNSIGTNMLRVKELQLLLER